MLCGGDEIARTQDGNNNAYCQDNEISWYDWNLGERGQRLLEFTQQLIALRKAHPNFRRRKFFQDREVRHSSLKDIAWYGNNGEEMTPEQWNAGWMRSIAIMYNGTTLDQVDEMGQPIVDDSFLILFNSYHDCVSYTLPASPRGRGWTLIMDTHDLEQPFKNQPIDATMDVHGRSVALLTEDGVREPASGPQHTEIPVIELELSQGPDESVSHSERDTQETASGLGSEE
jgi:glycogen operon protein